MLVYPVRDLLHWVLAEMETEGHDPNDPVTLPPDDDPGFPEDGGVGASRRCSQWRDQTMRSMNAQMNLATVVERNDLKKKLSSIQEIVR